MATQKTVITAYTTIEEKLLAAAEAGDLTALIETVNRLTMKERESVASSVYDTVLRSIVNHESADKAETAYATMMFIRAVGRYTSPEAVNAVLQQPAQPAPVAERRKETNNVYQLEAQMAIFKDKIALRRRETDSEKR